ncbi:WD40 repeat domain-containing protein [Salinisphaera sp. G21_0]|uniref:WD40 repeat domain-containing protein n=1 Tax=Salinisphaera sp. G21_0 TaxID=2821094 RepID=UPI001ADD1816|nr:WD40 repeat domain-containing protein [Salinisphaera sp. G21_0]MBO9482857.1 WD40 repeat domain-containing protein [Salinisphaera sp. G21_0]
MEPPITVNTRGNYGDNPDCAGVTPEVSRYVWNSNGMSVVPCQDQYSLLHLPEPPLLRLLGYLSFREILATAKTCTYLNQVITDEHLLARSWFAKLKAHQQNLFKEIARDISDRDLQHWLRQFTTDTTVVGKLCGQYLAEQTTDDGRKTCETQKRKYFPQVLFYTVSKLMADCRQFKPVLAKEILDTPGYAISLSTHGDHLVILSNHHTGTIFGCTANSPWHKQASFSFDYWLTADLPISNFETHGRHVLACDKHTATILAYNADNSCTEQLTIFHEGRISSADLSCDGHQAIITCDDGSARIHSWNDAGHWTLAADITDVRRRLKARFSPDGSRVLTHSNSCTKIHRRNEEGGWTLEATSDFYAESVTFSPDGSHVLMYSCYRGIIAKIAKILSLNKDGGWLESAPLTHNEGSVRRVIASPDGRHVITINQKDGETDSITMKILSRDSNSDWTEKTGNIPIIIHNGAQYWPKFSPDSRHAAIISADYRAARIYSYDEARGWTESGIIPHGFDGSCSNASFSPDSSHIATFCWYPVTLWDDNVRSKFKVKIYGYNGHGKWLPKAFIRHAGPIYSARFNADGTHLVTASEDGTAVILGRCADGSWVTKVILEHNYRVNSAFFSVDSRQVVTVNGSHNVKIWRLVAAGMVLDNPPGTPQAATGQGVVLHAGNQKPEANRQN